MKKTVLSIILALSLVMPLIACNKGGGEVTSVELSSAELTVNVGEQETLTYTVFPQGAADTGAKWLSSDPSVATVDGGVVTGVAAGSAAVRVTVGGKSAQCAVTVIDPSESGNAATGVTLSKHSVSLASVGATETVTASVLPAGAAQAVTWTSANPSVATVDGGVITAVGPGRTTVTARTKNNYFDSLVVVVAGETAEPELYVAAVDSLSNRDDFIMAMDSSELISLEAARAENGLTFKDFDGNTADILEVLKDNGITDIRIRVWNDPYDANHNGYGGGNCDVANAVALSTRCAAVGLGVIIDFHYSDFWADPGKQYIPKEWSTVPQSERAQKLYDFTKTSLEAIKGTGVNVKVVQIGNETTGGLAGASDEATIFSYMKKGAEAVKDTISTAKVAVHYTNAGNNDYLSRAQKLAAAGVNYDVFGTSWYPYYKSHGTLANLTKQLKDVHDKCGKDVMVLETAYAFTHDDFDGCGNTAFEATTRPLTVQGMANAVRDVIEAIANLGDYGLGVAYWGGTWVAASNSSDPDTNRALCLEHGCGWANSYAHSYDASAPSPAGSTPVGGGSMVDNNAFFLSDGTPIEALKVFKYVKGGHTTDITADYIEEQEIYYTVGQGSIELPATVDIVLNNGSEMETGAVWAVEKADLEQYIATVGTYTIEGTTSFGGTCICRVWVTNVNLLTEGSFEGLDGLGQQNGGFISTANLGDWRVRINKNSTTGNLQLYVSNESQNARMGTNTFHFWDSGAVDFSLYQMADMSKVANGKYAASFEFQGDQGENVDIRAYVTVTYKDGTTHTFSGDPETKFDGWTFWQRVSVEFDIDDVTNITSLEVGITVKSDPTGEGPWGNIDNCQFYAA